MKTKDWVLVVASLFLVIFLDQVSKFYSLSMPETRLGPLHMILIQNHGAMLGLFSDLPAFLRIVSLSTSGFFLLSIYCFLQYILPIRIWKLRIGLSLLIGGILGNVIDRTIYGFVIDFISFQFGDWHSPVWNIADMIQWIGYVLIVVSLLKEGHLLWPDQNSRNTFWVNKKFQIKYAAVFMMTGVLLTLISLVFSYTYLKITLTEILGSNPAVITKYTEAYLFSFLILVLAFSVALFIIAKIISHRIAGPVYAFERYLTAVIDGKKLDENGQALRLRAGDDFIHLEKLAEQVRDKINLLHRNQ
jgi:signal peptidase II